MRPQPFVLRLVTVTVGALTAATLTGFAAQDQAAPSAADLAQRIQAHYDTVRDFRAAFTQTTTSGTLGEKRVERGDVKIKKANRMFWSYSNPDKKIFVADGSRFVTYVPTPGDPQCTIAPLKQGEGLSEGLLFLAGRGNLVKDFVPAVSSAQPDGAWELTLVPRVPQEEFAKMTLVVDRRTLAMRSFATTDSEKSINRIDFTGLKENVGLKDSEFVFTPPRGVKCELPRP